MLVLVHDRASTGERMLEMVREIRGPPIVLAPTAPILVREGQRGRGPSSTATASSRHWRAQRSGSRPFAREVRRCDPARRVVLVGRLANRGLATKPAAGAPELEPRERAALEAGDVRGPEGDYPFGVDQIPVGRGSPAEHCITLGAEDDAPAPHCVFDPLSDPRFAPVDRGAPQSGLPSNST